MKKFNKLLSWILAFAMVIAMCPALDLTAFAADGDAGWYGDGTAAEYTISTAGELAQLAAIVNGTAEGIAQDSFSGKTVKLAGDIDLASDEWTPIGQVTVDEIGMLTTSYDFAGTFDGCGKTISGLNVSITNGGAALFGYVTGTVQNLTVSGTAAGRYYVAGVAAVGCGTFSGITNRVNVTVPADGQYAGGILGDALGVVSFTDCHNKGVITNGGAAADKSTGRYGGIVGRVDSAYSAAITNCSNTADITGYQYIGGIIGGAFGNVEIRGCFNTGTLTGISFGKIYVAGIAGKLGAGSIDSCYNWGTINASPWGTGHIRAVGGIAGCEEDHPAGTAITNCYNVGTINLDTSKMVTGKYIYLTGAISGGNNSDGNTMGYEDCFYLEGCIPAQDPDHESYKWWNASYKANPQIYDTENVLAKTESELQDVEVLLALGDSFQSNDEGYPLLTWQTGSSAPVLGSYGITAAVSGGTAALNVAESAQEGSTVSFTVSNMEEGKQIKSVTVTDAAGAAVTVRESEGTYSFTMPARAVSIAVVLENAVEDSAARYPVTLPAGLDAIWNVSVSSSQYDAETGTVAEGASVTIVVDKQAAALSTSFTGITVTAGTGAVETTQANVKAQNGVTYYAEYTFTMPAAAVAVELDITYADLSVYVKEGEAEAELQKALTRAEMVAMAETNGTGYYSGWSTETTPFIGVAQQYVTLEQILNACGITLEEGDSVTVAAPDNFIQDYTYEQLTAERKYYSDILENGVNATEGTPFGYAMVIKGNQAKTAEEVETVACDTLNAYRFVYGQTLEELTGRVKCVDSMPQSIVKLTVNKAEQTAATTDWYNEEDTTFTITTAGQLAGLAQLVDGGNTFAGKTILLGRDINLRGSAENVWNPIGSAEYASFDTGVTDEWGWDGPTILANTVKAGSAPFAGTFDGQGHSVTGLYISSSAQGQGLFAFNTGTIQNLTVSGTIAKAGSDYIGGVVGFNRGTIADVTADVTITAGGSYNVGGIAGYNDGYNEGTGAAALITRCVNKGNVTAYQALAGIAGENAGTIRYCANYGDITSTNTNGKEGTGGIVGRGGNNGTALTVSTVIGCYNTGAIKGNKWVGGVVGFNSATSYVSNSYDVGKVSGGGSTNPIVGYNEGAAAQNGGVYDCYYLNTMKVYDASGVYGGNQVNCAAKTEEELKSAEILTLLGDAYVEDTGCPKLADGYPILAWQLKEGGHSYEASVVAPTCTEAGYILYRCSVCGDSYSVEVVDALGHTRVTDAAVAPTCTASGLTEGIHCANCGEILVAQTVVDALGHTEVTDAAVAPTCTDTGLTAGSHCSVCEEILVAQTVVDALGHTEVADAAVAPTCTGTGLTAGSHCSVCEEVLVAQTVVDALGHSYAGGVCTVCGAEQSYVNPFVDVIEGQYYYDAVLWAAHNGITAGYGDETTFCPDVVCTRAQVVTFLWRVAGEPQPTSGVNPFTDIKAKDYYYTAVLWAVEQGITEGYGSKTTFNPDGECTRAQVATFLYRYADEPAVSGVENPFTDVESGEWYTDAILWAVAEGVTNGYGSETIFAPDNSCTRGQIVTFLYRYFN
ncbi:MAG: S-layer homology domain-containing protein [Oscillospiraceae bacterium]|nr:S-layer homology domain-containing protein [Oscillospiraceae bacterium]